jgi:hypothetical protein
MDWIAAAGELPETRFRQLAEAFGDTFLRLVQVVTFGF